MAHDAADQPALGVVAIGSVVGRERTQLDGRPGRNPKRVYATYLFEQLCDVTAFPGDADPDPLVFHLNDPSIVERALDHPVYHTSAQLGSSNRNSPKRAAWRHCLRKKHSAIFSLVSGRRK